MQLDKSSPRVRRMFEDIAPRYDFLNHLLSCNQDVRWRRRAVRLLSPRRGETILDLCCGTGDLSFEIARQQPACHVLGADFALPMLQLAHQKNRKGAKPQRREGKEKEKPASLFPLCAFAPLRFISADALHLPFASQSFDALSVAFGARNFEDTRRGLEEIHRVLKPGGRLLILEFMRPTSPLVQQFFGAFNLILAPIGRAISGHDCAYNYLPQSVGGFYTRGEFSALLRDVGFHNVRAFDHTGGVATSFIARKN